MTPRQRKTRDEPKHAFADYRTKARELLRVMNFCLQDEEWNAVFITGVHSAISMCDAICIFHLGQKSAGKSHQDAALLLGQATNDQKNVARLSELLNIKHDAEYTPRLFARKDAYAYAKKVDRLMSWAEEQLPQ
jgi:hypothetical protein